MDIGSLIISLILYGAGAAVTLLIALSVILYFTAERSPLAKRYEEEETYYDPATKTKLKFPRLKDPCEVFLSVIVPAYNEEQRLPPMLNEAVEFLEGRREDNPYYIYEIIVVSDGSSDGTAKVAESYSEKYGSEKIRCLNLIKNRGKGGAVQLGVQSSRGATILFADADGASKFEDLSKLEKAMTDKLDCSPVVNPKGTSDCFAVVIGSRAHLEKESLASRSIFRNILMYGFHFLVWLFTVKGIRDTQCGFKLFTRNAARLCFSNLHVHGWAFDVELLYIAQKLKIPISEIPVRWTEIEGSKVTPVWSWIQMGCDLVLIWLKYTIGIWKISTDKDD